VIASGVPRRQPRRPAPRRRHARCACRPERLHREHEQVRRAGEPERVVQHGAAAQGGARPTAAAAPHSKSPVPTPSAARTAAARPLGSRGEHHRRVRPGSIVISAAGTRRRAGRRSGPPRQCTRRTGRAPRADRMPSRVSRGPTPGGKLMRAGPRQPRLHGAARLLPPSLEVSMHDEVRTWPPCHASRFRSASAGTCGTALATT
jgi:hypothetical protein